MSADATSSGLFGGPTAEWGVRGKFVARESGVACGLPVIEELFRSFGPNVRTQGTRRDGDPVESGDALLAVTGPAAEVLALERVALNMLGRLCGLASGVARWVAAIEGTGAKLFDTRKTTPGWRYLEKYAVRVGGAENHRMHLADQLLVKDNHIAVLEAGGAWDMAERVASLRRSSPGLFLELEVDRRDQFSEALLAGVDAVLLDNFDVESVLWAVEERRLRAASGAPTPLLEVSGGVRFETIRELAETGVDRISVGRLTHSASDLDVGLDMTLAPTRGVDK